MKKIILKSIKIENFKGISYFFAPFSGKTTIFGANASGKTSVFDALWWLLFDKDSSGRSTFEVRPLDMQNSPIHHIEISVEAVVSVNDREYTLKKVQKENWVKGRNQRNAIFKGNVNEFYIDAFPQKQTDYKKFISDLCPEKTFQMITNPLAFPFMNWKEQRKILESIMPEVSESELAAQTKGYEQYAEELRGHTISEIIDRDKKAKSKAESDLKELPARLDELHKSIQEEPDAEMVQAERVRLQAQLSEVNAQITSDSGIVEKKRAIEQQIHILRCELSKKEQEIEQDYRKRKSEAIQKVSETERQIRDTEYLIKMHTRTIGTAQKAIEANNQKLALMREEYRTLLAEEFEESSLFCRYCGQPLPSEKIEQARAAFETGKQERIEQNKKEGKRIRQQVDIDTDSVNRLNAEIEEAQTNLTSLEQTLKTAKATKDSIPEPNFDVPEINALDQQINALVKEKETLSVDDVSIELKRKARNIQRQIDDCTDQLSAITFNQSIRKRISELEEEKKAVMQTIGTLEERIYMLEQLNVLKLNAISDGVNRKFKLVKWKLFETQINGAVIECCSCTFNGVPFSNLNTAMKVNAGLDIINTISNIYGVKAPVFIDNRESVTKILDIDSQIVNLVVSPDDKSIRVVEE